MRWRKESTASSNRSIGWMPILKPNRRPDGQPPRGSTCITTAGRTRRWGSRHRKRCMAPMQKINPMFPFLHRCVEVRYAHLHYAVEEKGKTPQQQPTTRLKVPNLFQDLTRKFPLRVSAVKIRPLLLNQSPPRAAQQLLDKIRRINPAPEI